MSTILMKIGKSLRAFRKSKGLGQAEFAAAAGASIATVSEWENGKYNPELTKLIKLSEEFNVSLDTLVFFEKESKDEFSKDEIELVKKYRKAPLNIKESIRLILNQFL